MEKYGLPYDMDCMKMAMLKHEETFKQQVYELHRLYQIQRMLMKNMQRSMQNQETWCLKSGTICFEYQNDYTLSNPQKQDPINENGSLEIQDESEIELTLGPTSYTRRRSKSTFTRQLNSDSIVEEQMRQVDRALNHPSLLRQVLI